MRNVHSYHGRTAAQISAGSIPSLFDGLGLAHGDRCFPSLFMVLARQRQYMLHHVRNVRLKHRFPFLRLAHEFEHFPQENQGLYL